MLNSHSCVGVAQSAFYIPTLIAAFVMVLQRRGKSTFPWAFITFFSLVRIVGGIVLVTYQQHMDSKGWTIAAVVFQGAGVLPLLIVQVGYLMIVHANDAAHNWVFGKGIVLLRVFFVCGISLLVTGSCFIGNYNKPSDVEVGEKLAKAGYLVIACVLGMVVSVTAAIRIRGWAVSTSSIKATNAVFMSFPFLVVRLSYACAWVFEGVDEWSPLVGSIAALVCMHSLMEYTVVLIALFTAFSMPCGRWRWRESNEGGFKDVI